MIVSDLSETAMKKSLAALALAAAFLPAVARAEDRPPVPRIIVAGEGEAAVAPDMAVLSLSVLRQAETARAALDANTAAMTEVIAALKADGIEPRDLQTSGFSINPRWFYPPARNDGAEQEQPRIVGYDVTNTLTVRVRNLALLGAVIDKSVSLGVNQGGQISFVNDNPDAVISTAREKAVADALARAKTLAKAAGVEVGSIVEISEQNMAPRPLPILEAKIADAAPVPIEAGQNAYRVTVNVTFEIRQ
jgi:uncharacterized protein YggE